MRILLGKDSVIYEPSVDWKVSAEVAEPSDVEYVAGPDIHGFTVFKNPSYARIPLKSPAELYRLL